MTGGWLEAFLLDALSRKLCTKISCTTCGAMEFRTGLLSAYSRASGEPLRQRYDDRKVNIAILEALSEINSSDDPIYEFYDPVRLVLYDLSSGARSLGYELEETLAGSWAGVLLSGMKRHNEERQARRRAHEEMNSPKNLEKIRTEKKRIKQEQHEKRLAEKKERDRILQHKNTEAD